MPRKKHDSETEARIRQAAIEHLRDYGFGLVEISSFSNMTPEEINNECVQLISSGIATTENVKDKFFDLFSRYFKTRLTNQKRTARNGSEFQELNLRFLDKPYLLLGEYCVVHGNSGTGKTFYVSLYCAAVSTGIFPTGERGEPGNVLYISGEETFDEIIDRIIRCGGDSSKCFVLDVTDSVGFSISDGFDEFLEIIKTYSPKLLVLDPWQCFVGQNVDLNRQNVLRPILQKLTLLAKKADCAVIVVAHVNKKDQGSDANNAVSGSSEIVNACRSAIRIIEDEKDEDRRIAVHTKSNHAKRGDSLCYRFLPDGKIRWDGISDITKADLEAAARQRKTPGEIKRNLSVADEQRQQLVTALLSEAENTEDCGKRLSYEDLKEKYSQTIFGSEQPKRALNSLEGVLKDKNILLKTGIQIRRNGKLFNGFYIQKIN